MAQMMQLVLQRAGDDLTRANLMKKERYAVRLPVLKGTF